MKITQALFPAALLAAAGAFPLANQARDLPPDAHLARGARSSMALMLLLLQMLVQIFCSWAMSLTALYRISTKSAMDQKPMDQTLFGWHLARGARSSVVPMSLLLPMSSQSFCF
jgi:hypothetical protein